MHLALMVGGIILAAPSPASGSGKHSFSDAMQLYKDYGVIPIEPIKPETAPSLQHFRKWTTRRAIFKTHFIDVEGIQGKRAYVDCGARTYSSSIGDFFNLIYPQSELFDEIHAFEVVEKYLRTYTKKSAKKVKSTKVRCRKMSSTFHRM